MFLQRCLICLHWVAAVSEGLADRSQRVDEQPAFWLQLLSEHPVQEDEEINYGRGKPFVVPVFQPFRL